MGSKQASFNKQILVVEDHLDSAELLEMVLSDEGYRVKCVYSGTAVLQFFSPLAVRKRKGSEDFDPDLILLDLRLPDMSGLEVVEGLRKLQVSYPPIILLSADSPKMLDEAIQCIGAKAVRKPFNFDELFSLVKATLEKNASN